MAQRSTRQAAGIEDWRLTRKKDREMRDEARKVSDERGYILATPNELRDRYPKYFNDPKGPDGDVKYLWAFGVAYPGVRKACITIYPLYRFAL